MSNICQVFASPCGLILNLVVNFNYGKFYLLKFLFQILMSPHKWIVFLRIVLREANKTREIKRCYRRQT